MTKNNSGIITSYELQALADGELDEKLRDSILEAVEKKPALKKKLYEIRRQRALLRLWWTQGKTN